MRVAAARYHNRRWAGAHFSGSHSCLLVVLLLWWYFPPRGSIPLGFGVRFVVVTVWSCVTGIVVIVVVVVVMVLLVSSRGGEGSDISPRYLVQSTGASFIFWREIGRRTDGVPRPRRDRP